ncbi:hypothetical protein ACUIAJ_09030 [Dermabacteraceae bacterium CCM 9519]
MTGPVNTKNATKVRNKKLDKSAQKLKSFYSSVRNPDNLVAFIDETFPQEAGVSYYGLAVVLVKVSDVGSVRAKLQKIVGTGYWHTRQLAKNNEFAKILNFAQNFPNQPFPMLFFSVKSAPRRPSEADEALIEKQRQQLLAETLKKVHVMSNGKVRMYVMESRQISKWGEAKDDKDIRTWAQVQSFFKGTKLKNFGAMQHLRPKDENCLWMADLVAWSVQRAEFAGDEGDLEYAKELKRLVVWALERGSFVNVGLPNDIKPNPQGYMKDLQQRIAEGK